MASPETENQESSPINIPVDSPGRKRLPPLLRKSWYSLNQAFRRLLINIKLTPDQFTVLRTLTESEDMGMPQCEISRKMSSDPNTIASLVERMEKLELITRKRNPHDKREKIINITYRGRDRYNQAREIAIDLQSQVLQCLPDSRRELFLQDLETISKSCQSALESAKSEE